MSQTACSCGSRGGGRGQFWFKICEALPQKCREGWAGKALFSSRIAVVCFPAGLLLCVCSNSRLPSTSWICFANPNLIFLVCPVHLAQFSGLHVSTTFQQSILLILLALVQLKRRRYCDSTSRPCQEVF